MDEATANIDYNTEKIIQEALSEALKMSTVITIAHRIKTIINYDKIVVLEKGKLIEFDSPSSLRSDPQSVFQSLCTKSNI